MSTLVVALLIGAGVIWFVGMCWLIWELKHAPLIGPRDEL